MSAVWQVVREIPLLVWLAVLVVVAWTRRRIVDWMGPDARSPSDPRHSGYVVNLTTGNYRKIGLDE